MSDPNWPPPAPPPYQSATPSAPSGAYAAWTARAGATLIDVVILIGVAIVIGLLFAAIGNSDSGVLGGVIFYYVAVFIYAPLTMMRSGEHNGQTLGRQATGIRVVRESGEPMGFWWSVLRELVCKGVLSLFTVPLLISYLWPLWDDRNQALHDKMASTLVVEA